MWSSLIFGSALVVFAVFMLIRHRVVWRNSQANSPGDFEREFLERQYWRRSQATAWIGAVGVAIAGSVLITDVVVAAAYWSAVLIVICWIVLLAVLDLRSTHAYFSGIHRKQVEEHAALRAELVRLKNRDANGRAPRHEGGDS